MSMKPITAFALLVALGACNTAETATFACMNGPDLAITTTEESATIAFSDGRTEVLPKDPSREGYFVKPGLSWTDTGFRNGRLNEGSSSYGCDQSSV